MGHGEVEHELVERLGGHAGPHLVHQQVERLGHELSGLLPCRRRRRVHAA